MRLWDPDDVVSLVVVKTKKKGTVKVHSMATEETSDNKDDVTECDGPWLSYLGMDNHTAMSLMTGMLRPPSGRAWQYAADWADWKAETFVRQNEVVVHCCCSSKKVSALDSISQLEIICRPEKR
jgi:hypothetical protein